MLGIKDLGRDRRRVDQPLGGAGTKHTQAAAGLEQHMAAGRPDIAYVAKTVLRSMSRPDMLMAMRAAQVARYLKQRPPRGWDFGHQRCLGERPGRRGLRRAGDAAPLDDWDD